MYEGFAHWLTLVYRQQNNDKPLAPGMLIDYFGCLINLALHNATIGAPRAFAAGCREIFHVLGLRQGLHEPGVRLAPRRE